MTVEHFDVVVVGGGLVGASLVHALSDTALTIAWVDASSTDRLTTDPRSTALALASQKLLDDLGVWCDLVEHAAPIHTVHVSQQHHFGSVSLRADDLGVEALGYVLANRALALALSRRVTTQANVQVFAPQTVSSISSGDGVETITLASGTSLRTSLVIAADGASSSVRELAEIGNRRRVEFDQHAVVAEVQGSGWPSGQAWERFCNYGPLALLPMSEDRLSLVYTVPDSDVSRVLGLSDQAFLDEIGQRAGFVGRFTAVTARHSFPLVALEASAAWQGRVLLIGNALRTLHPVAGQGFNLALRDALTLAELLAALPQGADPGDESLRRRYTALRRSDQAMTALGTEAFARLFRGESRLLGHLRGLGLLVTDRISPVRQLLARQFMGLGGRLPHVRSRN